MDFTIRGPVLADAWQIARVHVSSWQTSYRGIVPGAYLDGLCVRDRWELRTKIIAGGQGIQLVCVAADPGTVVGFADAGPSRDSGSEGQAELYAIYLVEEHKRCGLGRRLFQCAADELMRSGFASMHLWVIAENVAACRFYEKMGGVICGTASEEIGGRSCPLVSYAFKFGGE